MTTSLTDTQIANMPAATFRFSATGATHSQRFSYTCPNCGASKDAATPIDERGYYVRTVVYKCTCGKWYTVTI